jgi:glyoxylase I family protein
MATRSFNQSFSQLDEDSLMHITGMVHININCSNFQKSKVFYEMLGFKVYWPVPETNTTEIANAVGMPSYRVEGALMELQNAQQRMVIDLLEWKSPKDDSPPYPNLHRPGLSRVALVDQGVEVVSAPVNVITSETSYARFFCFKDPDGTFLELVQVITTE